jgi:hypothetical protein
MARDANDIHVADGVDTLREMFDATVAAKHNATAPEDIPLIGSGGEGGIVPEQLKALLQSSAKFSGSLVPPDFLVEGILQRRYIYALTAHTGRGKTALALLLAAHVATGRNLGNLEVDKGRVLILAGENPTDAKMRWVAMGQQMDFDVETIDVHFIEGVFKLSQNIDLIRREVEALGGVDFIIIDSSAAFFEGDDENSNSQQGSHARLFRELPTLAGGPCVLVLCHPPKNAGNENLQPRGGGAYIAEIDGNLTASKDDMTVVLHWQGKLRGPDFAPISFLLRTVTHERLITTKGRLIPTVVAHHLSEAAQDEMSIAARRDEDLVLEALQKSPGASLKDIANKLGWHTKKGEPYKSKVHRIITRLKREKLLTSERGRLTLSEKGQTALKAQ